MQWPRPTLLTLEPGRSDPTLLAMNRILLCLCASCLSCFSGLVLAPAAEKAPVADVSPRADAAVVLGDPRFPLQPVREIFTGGRYRMRLPPNGIIDPIAPLAQGDAEILAGRIDNAVITAYLARYIDRVEAHYAPVMKPEFLAWLAQKPGIRHDFWLALSWAYDDIPAAGAILDDLRTRDAKRTERYAQLAIAFAVVHDNPLMLRSSLYHTVHGVSDSQYAPIDDYGTLFDYFTEPKHLNLFPFKPDHLSWSMLVHVVDLDASARERRWVLATLANRRTDIAGLYQMVKYDTVKLESGGTRTKLGTLPYSLDNLLTSGGICGDQSHFTSRVAKSFGIPAMKCSGNGRYGGMGHAWSGFLTAKGRRPVLEFTGRFQFDYFYTGDIYDPQTGTETLDRYVALSYDGASLSFPKMQEASALSRAAQACFSSDAATSLILAKTAIDRNTYCADAWRVLMTHVAEGRVPRKEAQQWGSRMLKDLKDHPDLTIECVGLYLRSIPLAEQDDRQRLWNGAYALYGQRPDLQIALRVAQCAELVAVEQASLAIQQALSTIVPNAKEGTLILPLVELAVTMTQNLVQAQPRFPVDKVKAALAQADGDFPKSRGNEPSAAYKQFRALVGQL